MKRRFAVVIFVAILSSIILPMKVGAMDIPSAPSLDKPIVDNANILKSDGIELLSKKINDSRTKKDYQIAILTIPKLEDNEYIEGYALKVARKWGIGDSEKDNGVLIVVSVKDRKIRIEVGRGTEAYLTDAEAGRIIRNVISPEFKRSNYVSGLSKAIESIAAQVESRTDPNEKSDKNNDIITCIAIFAFIFLPIIIIALAESRKNNKGKKGKSKKHKFFDDNDNNNLFSGTRGPWIGSGGSSGGGGSFGGGGFGGGGSSGGW